MVRPMIARDEFPPASESVTKRSLVTICHAMERSFDHDPGATVQGSAGLVIGLFQRREYFDVEADR